MHKVSNVSLRRVYKYNMVWGKVVWITGAAGTKLGVECTYLLTDMDFCISTEITQNAAVRILSNKYGFLKICQSFSLDLHWQ